MLYDTTFTVFAGSKKKMELSVPLSFLQLVNAAAQQSIIKTINVD